MSDVMFMSKQDSVYLLITGVLCKFRTSHKLNRRDGQQIVMGIYACLVLNGT